MLRKKNQQAVSAIIGSLLILVLSSTVFTGFYFIIISDETEEVTDTTIVGYIESDNMLYFEHRSGDSVSIDSELSITTDDNMYTEKIVDVLVDNTYQQKYWNIGEVLEYDVSGFSGRILVNIVDTQQDKLIWSGEFDLP